MRATMISRQTAELLITAALMPALLALLAFLNTGCKVPLTDAGQYLQCSDGECRTGYACRLVEGTPACVPDDKADDFPDLFDGDAGDVDEDTAPRDATDSSTDTDSDTDDVGDSAMEDAEIVETDAECPSSSPELSLSWRNSANELDAETTLAGANMTLRVDSGPQWATNGSAAELLVVVSDFEGVGYDDDRIAQEFLEQPIQLDPTNVSGPLPFRPVLVGNYSLNVVAVSEEGCRTSGKVDFQALPFLDEVNGVGRCVYIEYFWASPDFSRLYQPEPGFDLNELDAAGTQLQYRGYWLGYPTDQTPGDGVESYISLDHASLPPNTAIFYRVFQREDEAAELEHDATTDPANSPMEVGIIHSTASDDCQRYRVDY
jgi:hypothetical protein